MTAHMTRTFREAFLEALEATGWPISRVAAEAGVSAEQLKKLKQGRSQSTNVDDALRVAHVFGVTLDEFLCDNTAQIRSEVADLWRLLSPEERDILLAAARGRAVQNRGE